MARLYRCDSCEKECEKVPTVPLTIGIPTETAIGNFGTIDLCSECTPIIRRASFKETLINALQDEATRIHLIDANS